MAFRFFLQDYKKQKQRVISDRDHTCDLQSLKYLLPGPIQEKFASPWSRISTSKSDPSAEVASWVWFLDYGSSDMVPLDLKTSGLRGQNICLSHTQYLMVR